MWEGSTFASRLARKRRRRKQNSQLLIAGLSGIPPFSPDDIASLTAWYDAEDNSTITENPAGFAQEIRNKQATPKTYRNVNAGQKPALVSVAGHQMLSFDGNDWFADVESNGVLQPGSGDFSVLGLFRSGSAAIQAIWSQRDGAGMPSWLFRLQGGGPFRFSLRDAVGPAIPVDSADADFGDDSRYVVIGSRDGTNLRLYWAVVGGSLAESTTSPVAIGAYGSVDAVNSTVGVESPTGVADFLIGEIGELMFFNGAALTAAERAQLMGYLNTKWA